MSNSKKVFLLGVGCQKGGTTWLHGQLAKHPEVDLGFTKEYHIFDALHIDDMKYFAQQKLNKLQQLRKETPDEIPLKLLRHVSFHKNTKNYFKYFDYLWGKNEQTKIVGDITPSYSALPKEVFQEIKDNLENKGFKVKVVFLMRDPIERCWSMARMSIRDSEQNRDQYNDDVDRLKDLYKQETCSLRTRYENTIRNLDSCFEAGDIFYGFYENLFTQDTITRLENFLDIEDFSPDTKTKYNITDRKELNLDKDLARDIANFYRDTYDICQDRFNIKEHWAGYQYL